MPRIIAGRYRGLRLAAPPGLNTRPTADRIKEAVFSMLESLPFNYEGARVIDFFAGSGALGLEALSRGASSAVLADADRGALAAIKKNISALGPGPEALPLPVRWPQGLARLQDRGPFNLFLLDPPYEQIELPLTLLRESAGLSLAAPGAAAVWEQAPPSLQKWTDEDVRPWRRAKDRVWGARAAAFLIYESNEEAEL